MFEGVCLWNKGGCSRVCVPSLDSKMIPEPPTAHTLFSSGSVEKCRAV